jgi:hypothetical protein
MPRQGLPQSAKGADWDAGEAREYSDAGRENRGSNHEAPLATLLFAGTSGGCVVVAERVQNRFKMAKVPSP